MKIKFDLNENKDKIDEFKVFIERNKEQKGALMPVLQEAQAEFGYLPTEVLEIVSEGLDVRLARIHGVSTFYSQFTFIPKGIYDISVCMGTACYVKGSQDILEEIEKELGIKSGETTRDLMFSITPTRCIGDCGLAPVITINKDVYGHLKLEEISGIIEKYR